MKLNKIIIGLSAVGLISSALALVGDSGLLGADVADTPSATLGLCNFYQDSVTWDFQSDDPTHPVILANKAITLQSGECQALKLQGPSQSTRPLIMPGFTLASTHNGNTSKIHVKSITQIDGKVTSEMLIDTYASNNNPVTLFSNGGETKVDDVVSKLTQNTNGGTGIGYNFCTGSDGQGKQCNDFNTANRK